MLDRQSYKHNKDPSRLRLLPTCMRVNTRYPPPHTYTHTHTHARTHAHTRRDRQTHTHTHTRTRTHTHTHTHTRTRTYSTDTLLCYLILTSVVIHQGGLLKVCLAFLERSVEQHTRAMHVIHVEGLAFKVHLLHA